MNKKIKSVVYGIGGYDETMPDNNIVSYEYYSKDELAQLEAKAKAEADKAAQKQALLDRLGITQEEAQLLLGGN